MGQLLVYQRTFKEMGIMGIEVFEDFFRGKKYSRNASKKWLNLDVTFSVSLSLFKISQFLATELWR